MKKKDLIIKDCEKLFALFNTDCNLVTEISSTTNNPYNDSVSNFLEKQEGPTDHCDKCWERVVPVAFTYGFVMALILKPNSKVSLKGIQNIGRAIKKAVIDPLIC